MAAKKKSRGLENERSSEVLKFILTGNSGVGKTSLLDRFIKNTFKQSTTITLPEKAVESKVVEWRKKRNSVMVKIDVWDTVGMENFKSLTNSFYRNTNGIIIVYDISDEKTFTKSVKLWHDEAQTMCRRARMMLIGNKCDKDMDRQVTKERGQKLADSLDIHFFETSAKSGVGVEDSFMDLMNSIMIHEDRGPKKNKKRIGLKESGKKGSCCS